MSPGLSDSEIVLYYSERLSSRDIAEIDGRSRTTILEILHKYGVVRSRSLATHLFRTKTPRKESKNGYVIVWIGSEDEFAEMRHDGGSILEHRLVMARHLGRSLFSSEAVHHINGDRSDNRIENLELWSTVGQPGGQRVSDLRKWALEILELYPEEL